MDLGDTLTFRADVYSAPPEDGGTLANAQTAVLTVTLPDGTAATPTVTNPSTGKYAANYVTTATSPVGKYTGQWLFTFFGGNTTSYVESFDVGVYAVVTVDEALQHLRAQGVIATDADLDYLESLCFTVTDAIERDLGRAIVKKTYTDTLDGGNNAIALRHRPVISVTSVTEWNLSLTSSDYVVDYNAGVIYRGTGPYLTWGPLTWAGWGRQSIVVTYVAGYTDPPRIVRKVALNTIQGMWQESQQAPNPAMAANYALDSATLSATAMLTPVEQRAYDSLRVVGFA